MEHVQELISSIHNLVDVASNVATYGTYAIGGVGMIYALIQTVCWLQRVRLLKNNW